MTDGQCRSVPFGGSATSPTHAAPNQTRTQRFDPEAPKRGCSASPPASPGHSVHSPRSVLLLVGVLGLLLGTARTSLRILQGVADVLDDGVHMNTVLHLCEDGRAVAAHLLGVTIHHPEVSADELGKVGLVDDEQVGLGDAGATLTRYLVPSSNVDHVDREVGELLG